MESSIITKNWALLTWVVLSTLISTASSGGFQDCYGPCFLECIATPGVAFVDCPMRCLKTCITPSTNINNVDDNRQQENHFYCELGCATSSCTKFSTMQSPAAQEVGSCVHSCSQTCSMN